MPKYSYKCADCDAITTAWHSMSERLHDCPHCSVVDALVRLPSNFSIKNKEKGAHRVGDVVEQSIEDFRHELETEKKKLKSQEASDVID